MLDKAISLTCELLKAWQAFRSGTPGLSKQLIPMLQKQLPSVILNFQRKARALGIRRILDIRPNDPEYSTILLAMAAAVNEIAKIKQVHNPMLGSKVMHFFFPEYFPVWDTGWIKKRCLANEIMKSNGEILKKLGPGAGSDYASYVHLMVIDLVKTPDYSIIRKACLQRAWMSEEIADWHYYDIAPTVFEICLLGKYVR